MKTAVTILFPTLAGILIGIALAQAPLAQQNPLKPTAYATSIASAGAISGDMSGVWLLFNDGSVKLCTGRLGATPSTPRCSDSAQP
ncbi:hypothetical protein [Caenispirillum salinarum]|uniref:hypothetical protein n=1 Tax=Caenispirillum salinarum TaxID=859058 RepID=UPI00385029D8